MNHIIIIVNSKTFKNYINNTIKIRDRIVYKMANLNFK